MPTDILCMRCNTPLYRTAKDYSPGDAPKAADLERVDSRVQEAERGMELRCPNCGPQTVAGASVNGGRTQAMFSRY